MCFGMDHFEIALETGSKIVQFLDFVGNVAEKIVLLTWGWSGENFPAGGTGECSRGDCGTGLFDGLFFLGVERGA